MKEKRNFCRGGPGFADGFLLAQLTVTQRGPVLRAIYSPLQNILLKSIFPPLSTAPIISPLSTVISSHFLILRTGPLPKLPLIIILFSSFLIMSPLAANQLSPWLPSPPRTLDFETKWCSTATEMRMP